MHFLFSPLFFSSHFYPESQHSNSQMVHRILSGNQEMVKKLAERLGLIFTPVPETEGEVCFIHSEGLRPEFKLSFTTKDVLNYLYAVLHSPAYQEMCEEDLTILLPDIPYPTDTSVFWQLVQWGHELRQIHSLESPLTELYRTAYPVTGNNTVETVHYEAGKVFINQSQYFVNVPEIAWHFSLAGPQPSRQWLQDRIGNRLSAEDILHYQKIIAAITGTDLIMKEIAALQI